MRKNFKNWSFAPKGRSVTKQQIKPMTPEESLARMRLAADNFYYHVAAIECQAFIELTGVMREYIKLCEKNLAHGIDFRDPNGLPGQRMQLQPYEIAYF